MRSALVAASRGCHCCRRTLLVAQQAAHRHASTRRKAITPAASGGPRVAQNDAEPSTSGRDNDGAPHIPVLMREVLELFSPVKIRVYVDGTLGAGGHASAVMRAHPVRGGGDFLSPRRCVGVFTDALLCCPTTLVCTSLPPCARRGRGVASSHALHMCAFVCAAVLCASLTVCTPCAGTQ